MNVLVDQIMTNATFSILQSIIEMHGFEKYQSIEFDESFAPVKLDLGLTDKFDFVVMKNKNTIVHTKGSRGNRGGYKQVKPTYDAVEQPRLFLADKAARLINTNEVVEQYLDLKYIAKNICQVRVDGYLGIDTSDADCNCFDLPQSEIDKICAGVSKELLTLRFNKLEYNLTVYDITTRVLP